MLFSTPLITGYSLLVTGLFGLVMGSFLNCLAWRLTHGESVLRGRSHCISCGHVLAARDLVPVLSWLFTRGRCRYCHERIPARYPLTELLCAALYLSVVVRYDLTLETVEMLVFASTLLVLSLTDLDECIIPNSCIAVAVAARALYGLALLATGSLPAGFDIVSAVGYYVGTAVGVLVALIALALVMDRVLGRDSIGGGDVKLLAVAALYFGGSQLLLVVFVSCVLGIVFGFARMGSGDEADDAETVDSEAVDEEAPERVDPHAFPWGPSIALACWFCMLFGEQLVGMYLGLFAL